MQTIDETKYAYPTFIKEMVGVGNCLEQSAVDTPKSREVMTILNNMLKELRVITSLLGAPVGNVLSSVVLDLGDDWVNASEYIKEANLLLQESEPNSAELVLTTDPSMKQHAPLSLVLREGLVGVSMFADASRLKSSLGILAKSTIFKSAFQVSGFKELSEPFLVIPQLRTLEQATEYLDANPQSVNSPAP